jgi:hypothetical protein
MFKIVMDPKKKFKHFFSFSNVHQTFSKFKRILILKIKKEKVKMDEICSKTHLSKFGSN